MANPMELAWRLLKAPIIPGSVKVTQNDDEKYSLRGKFLDPKTEETMPIFADLTKPIKIPGDEYDPDFVELGDIDLGISHPDDPEWDDRRDDRRSALQLAQLRDGNYIPGPSTADMALRTQHQHTGKGYAKALFEMLGKIVEAHPGEININPFADGLTPEGFGTMQQFMKKNPKMLDMMKQGIISQIPNNPKKLIELNMLNSMLSSSRGEMKEYADLSDDANRGWTGEDDNGFERVRADVANRRGSRGDQHQS